jgi:hypothetical protein
VFMFPLASISICCTHVRPSSVSFSQDTMIFRSHYLLQVVQWSRPESILLSTPQDTPLVRAICKLLPLSALLMKEGQ